MQLETGIDHARGAWLVLLDSDDESIRNGAYPSMFWAIVVDGLPGSCMVTLVVDNRINPDHALWLLDPNLWHVAELRSSDRR